MTTRAVVYCRVSTTAQDAGDRTSLDEQASACRAYAEQRGYEIVDELREIASGADRKRPLFRRLPPCPWLLHPRVRSCAEYTAWPHRDLHVTVIPATAGIHGE